MKYLFIKMLLLSVISTSAGADSRLIGKWVSDRDMTISFVKKHLKRTDEQLEVLAQMFGRMVIVIDKEGQYSINYPDHEIQTQKKSYEMEGFEAEGSYKVLGTDKNSTAIKLNASNKDDGKIELIHFVSEDVIWIYSGGDEFLEDSHIREYFRRNKSH